MAGPFIRLIKDLIKVSGSRSSSGGTSSDASGSSSASSHSVDPEVARLRASWGSHVSELQSRGNTAGARYCELKSKGQDMSVAEYKEFTQLCQDEKQGKWRL